MFGPESDVLMAADPLLAYAGPAAGLEFIPYFLGLLAWAGVALGAALGWPLAALRRRLREGGSQRPATPQ
jgi:hypothetical protein